ncbi:MAG: DUF885 family protein [Gemmatimonadales bacterium]
MSGLGELCRSYLDVRWLFDPAQGTRAGNAASDGLLPMLDAESVRLQLATLRSLAGAIEELAVDDDEEIDRTALLDDLRTTIFRFETEGPHRHNPAAWLAGICQAWQSLIAYSGASLPARAQAALARLEAAPAALAEAEATLRSPAVVFVDEAIELIPAARRLPAELAAFGRRWLPELGSRLEAAALAADAALVTFGERLRAGVAPIAEASAFAVGEDEFDHRLHFEHALHSGAPELWRWGQRRVEELTAAMSEAASRVEAGADFRTLIERLRREHPVGADHQLRVLREVTRARKFVDDRGLLTPPPGDVRILETPEFLRPLIPIAGYEAPGVLYLTPPGLPLAEWELTFTVLREVCPGHQMHRARAAGLLSEIRRFIVTPVAVDGWALYAADMMYKAGFAESAEEELFHQCALLHAAALVVVDVGLHTRGMTPADAVEYLTGHVPLSHGAALVDVRRACAWPTYSLAAAVGCREIEQLHESWRARAGGDAPIKAFHDTLLGYGGLPISLARWGMDLGLDE